MLLCGFVFAGEGFYCDCVGTTVTRGLPLGRNVFIPVFFMMCRWFAEYSSGSENIRVVYAVIVADCVSAEVIMSICR